MLINIKVVLSVALWINLGSCFIEATPVDLADIKNNAYFGEISDESVEEIIQSDDFKFGLGDFLYYYARAREFASRTKYQDGIRELNKALKYCYQDEDKAYVLSFRALLNVFLINEEPIHKVYAIDDYTKAYVLTKDLHALFNRAKVKIVIGNYQSALSDLEIIIKHSITIVDKQMLTSHDYSRQSVKHMNKVKFDLLKRCPYYLKSLILKGFVYYKFLYDYDSAIQYYKTGLGLLKKDDSKAYSLASDTFMLSRDPRALNNLAMAYLMRGKVEDLDFAKYLIESAKKQDPSSLIFQESEFFYYTCCSDFSLSRQLYLEIIGKLKASSKMEKGMLDFISLIYDYDNKYVILRMIENLFFLSSSQIKLKDLITTLAAMPNLLVAVYVANEIKVLQQENKLTDINLRESLLKKYQLKMDPQIISNILTLPSLYSFSNGYITTNDFAQTIAMKFSLYKQKDIEQVQVLSFLEYIEKHYGRSFFSFFTRLLHIKHGITHQDFMKNIFNTLEIKKIEMRKSKEELENLKKKVMKS